MDGMDKKFLEMKTRTKTIKKVNRYIVYLFFICLIIPKHYLIHTSIQIGSYENKKNKFFNKTLNKIK